MVGILRSYPIQLGQLQQHTFSVQVVGVCGTFMSMNTGLGDGVGGVLLKNIMNKETSTPPGICYGVLHDTTLGNGLWTKSATIIIYIHSRKIKMLIFYLLHIFFALFIFLHIFF